MGDWIGFFISLIILALGWYLMPLIVYTAFKLFCFIIIIGDFIEHVTKQNEDQS